MSQAGPHKFNFCKRLGQNHHDLADYLDIKSSDRARWEQGRECWGILEWLEDRERLPELQEALIAIDRKDLVEIVQAILAPGDMDFRGTVSYAPDPDGLLSGIAQREAANNDSTVLSDERHRRIDQVHVFINQGQFNQAAQYLEALKQELWLRADDKLKYRLLVNLGMARLGMDEINDAVTCFLEALQYNPTDDRAITYAAMGYLFQKDNANANKLIEEALQKNPANALAYSLRIRTTPITETIESALEQIPPAYHTTPDVLVALGEAALNRKLYGEAVEYWEAALGSSKDRSMDSVKAFLGVALIEPTFENHVLIAAGQILDSEKHRLEQAITLFTEVLGGIYINPNDLSHTKFTALANRSAALRLLGRFDEAIRDIDIALQKEPEDSSLIKQRVLLAHDKGNEAEAYSYAQQILSSPITPEASLLAASSLMTLSRFEEAEVILNEFLQKDIPKHLKFQAKQIKFDLFLERNDRQSAEKILEEVNEEDADSVFTVILNIRWQKHIGSEDFIPALVDQAKAALNQKTFLSSKFIFADFLYTLNYYRDAAEVYEKFVDKSLNTEICRRLLESYYFAGNYKDALDLSQRLLDEYEPSKFAAEIAAHIYEDIGDLNNAKQVCEKYIDIFPNDLSMQLRLATIHYAKGEYKNLDEFLDSISSIETLGLAYLKKLAQLYKNRNLVDKFLEVVYEIRHRFYGDRKIHSFYEISFIEANKLQSRVHDFEAVKDNCGVLLRNELGNETWYILEERSDTKPAQDELNSSSPIYNALMGKSIGDEIVFKEDHFGKHFLKIVAITDKYFAAGKQSLSILEKQPDENFRILTVPMDGDNISDDWVKQLLAGLQQQQNQFDDVKAKYTEGGILFGTFANLVKLNPIELWQILAFGPSSFIHSWSNFENEKFEDALIALRKGGLVVIDPISLITLHHLRVSDHILKLLGKFGIAQSTIDLFQFMVETKQVLEHEGSSSFGVDNGQGIIHEFAPELISQQKKFFEDIIDWIRKNCIVLTCNRALNISQEERSKLNKTLGVVFADTVLIAGEPGRILYSDDQWLRCYAHSDSGVHGVWTQAVLKYCLVQKSSNETLYRKATLDLAIQGYTYTIIDADILLEAAKLTEWKPQSIYTAALRSLANENTTLEQAASVAADFFYKLYLEAIKADTQLLDPRDDLVFELLKILTIKRSIRKFVQVLKYLIHKKFTVIPLQKQKILNLIDVWLKVQFIIT